MIVFLKLVPKVRLHQAGCCLVHGSLCPMFFSFFSFFWGQFCDVVAKMAMDNDLQEDLAKFGHKI
jgi:hypothetical protein